MSEDKRFLRNCIKGTLMIWGGIVWFVTLFAGCVLLLDWLGPIYGFPVIFFWIGMFMSPLYAFSMMGKK